MTLETLRIEFQAEASGLEGQLAGLASALDSFGGRLDAIGAQALPAGRLMADNFAAGARGGIGAAQSAGSALAAGFAAGITARTGAVLSAARSMVNQATALMRSALSIHSPSKVTAELGGRFGEGFARGILATARDVGAAAGALGSAGVDALAKLPGIAALERASAIAPAGDMSAALPKEAREAAPLGAEAAQRAMENLNLTIPLNVDGMKLGEASIRGINAVTRSAGRVLLNI